MEEWNEYGELKEHVSLGAASPAVATPSPTPSSPSKIVPLAETPSKVRFSADTPTKTTQSAATGSPLTIAMRQAGAEAAKKASDAKSQSRAKVLGVSQASGPKMDNSTAPAPETPSQSRTTDTASAIAPEIGSTTINSTADNAETTEVLTKPSEGLGSSGKGNSNSDRIVQSASQDLPEASESSEQETSTDKLSQAADQGLEGGDSDTQIVSREATDVEKPKTGDQGVIEPEGERKEDFKADHSKLKTVTASTEVTQAK